MADPIQRLNYFNGQFLREPDFTAEQAYHVQHARDHARLLHTPGIATGLEVPDPAAGATAVTVNAGVAYDDLGRRIVLANNFLVELASLPAGQAVYITITYDETQTDPTNETGVTGETRWTEAPLIEASANAPADPNQKLVLAHIARTGNVVGTIDRGDRRSAGVKGGDLEVRSLTLSSESVAQAGWVKAQLGASGRADVGGSLSVAGNLVVTGSIQGNMTVNTAQIADGAVTLQKLAPTAQPLVSVEGVSNPGGGIDLVAGGAITVVGNNITKQIAIGETHSSRTDNPHSTTATQIDTLGGANRLVTQINSGTGLISEPRIDAAIARASALTEKLNGKFVQGSVTIPATGSIYIAVTNQNMQNRLVGLRGWASGTANGAPGVLTGNYQQWAPVPANFREAWALSVFSGGVGWGGTLTFVEGALTITLSLSLGTGGVGFSIAAPVGTTVGYGFQFTWQ